MYVQKQIMQTEVKSTHELIVTGEQIAKCSIPPGPPEHAAVINVTELGALVRGGGVGVDDALLLHQAGAQADALAGVLLAQASDTMDRIECNLLHQIAFNKN